jgi:hypothetical protein
VHHDTTYHGIGCSLSSALFGKFEAPLHVCFVRIQTAKLTNGLISSQSILESWMDPQPKELKLIGVFRKKMTWS